MAVVNVMMSVLLPALAPIAKVLAETEMTEEELAERMPGLGAFIVFVFLAICLYFLLRNMNARLRRMSYRDRERQDVADREAAELAAEREAAELDAERDEPEGRPEGEQSR